MPLSRSDNKEERNGLRERRLMKQTYFCTSRSERIQLGNTSKRSKVSRVPLPINRTKGKRMAKPKKGPAFTADPFHA